MSSFLPWDLVSIASTRETGRSDDALESRADKEAAMKMTVWERWMKLLKSL